MIGSSDPLARQGFSRSASSTDYKYAYIGPACEKPPAGLGLERLATAFMNNPGY
jgi:hypothetical protein